VLFDDRYFHALGAAIFVGLAASAFFGWRSLFGVNQFLRSAWYRAPIERQNRLRAVVIAVFGNGEAIRTIGQATALFSLLIAALCFVPGVPLPIPIAVGFLGFGCGVALSCLKLPEKGDRRAATLSPRNMPLILWLGPAISIAATVALAWYPPMRLGAILGASAMLALWVVAKSVADSPARLPGTDPVLESAIIEHVRRGQLTALASLICAAAVFTWAWAASTMMFVHQHSWVVSIGMLPVSAASFAVSMAVRNEMRSSAVANALTASPA
jgi:hypothetical protein